MAVVNKGDLLLDLIYVGDNQKDYETVGIVLHIDETSAIVYWFDESTPWGVNGEEYEIFDLTKEGCIDILNDLKQAYESSKLQGENE